MKKLILNCDICARAETYKCETEFFQDGIMHGMQGAKRDEIHCIDCINKSSHIKQNSFLIFK